MEKGVGGSLAFLDSSMTGSLGDGKLFPET